MTEEISSPELPPTAPGPDGRVAVVTEFAASDLFERTFREGMELVEETAAYLDGEGRRDSKLLSRSSALAYAGESMRLTTRLMQIASWLLVQRAVREGDMQASAACEARYRLAARKVEGDTPPPADLPIALVEYSVRAEKLYDRIHYLDRRMYVDETPPADTPNPVQSQFDRLSAAFGGGTAPN